MLDKHYQPAAIEARIHAAWEDAQAFRAGRTAVTGAKNAPYCIVIPPPNVTGSLHMGHALNNTLQDILCRFERMRGRDVLWQPGTDHAGIATQMVVERQLAADKQPGRRDLGREKFLEKVWQWKAESGGTIINQLKRLGASCDWSRERFTMDEGLSKAVLEFFVKLHDAGLIYKAKRLVNWDPKFQTAISDLEVEQKEIKGHLWHFRYPLKGVAYQRRRSRDLHRHRHHAAGDAAGRHRGRGQSEGRALQASGRQDGGAAAGRPRDPDHRRRLFRSREGLGRGQDHAGARLQRLRGRPPAQPGADQHPRRFRQAQRSGSRRLIAASTASSRASRSSPTWRRSACSTRSSRIPTSCRTATAPACRSSRI